MTTLTADETTLALLRRASGLVEIRDAAGTVVGFFAPVSIERAHLYAQAAAQVDPQELKRRKEADGETRTTQEVLEHLRSLEAP